MTKVICVYRDFHYKHGVKYYLKLNKMYLAQQYLETSPLYEIFTLDGLHINVFGKNSFMTVAEFREKRIDNIFED